MRVSIPPLSERVGAGGGRQEVVRVLRNQVSAVNHTIVQAFYDHIDRARTLHYKSVKNDAVAMTARRCERCKLDEDGWH